MSDTKYQTLKVGSVEIPVPAAMLPWLVVVLLLGGGGWFVWSHVDADKRRISQADLLQLEHANRHLTEVPESTLTMFNDRRGLMLAKLYSSDLCTLIELHSPSGLVSSRFMYNLQAPAMPAAPVHTQPIPFAETPVEAQGRCVNPHPGEFTVTNQALDSCTVRVWRTFADGCIHFQDWNGCASVWGPVTWTRCVH